MTQNPRTKDGATLPRMGWLATLGRTLIALDEARVVTTRRGRVHMAVTPDQIGSGRREFLLSQLQFDERKQFDTKEYEIDREIIQAPSGAQSFIFSVAGLSDRLAETIVEVYRTAGWRPKLDKDKNGQPVIHMQK